MSRVTRSSMMTRRTANNDENAIPQAHAGKSGKGLSAQTSTRAALGDISNQAANQLSANDRQKKKTRIVDSDIAKPTSINVITNKEDENALAGGVADLRLGSVDANDVNDPLCVTEYINYIMDHLHETEGTRIASPNYMALKQNDINAKMREILIDWLVEVHLKFKLRPETLFLTVNLIDRFLEIKQVSRTKLQLVGCTAMLIASKYEEIYAPEVRDFVYISDKAYTRDQILSMESIMLNALGFHCTTPSSLRFTERLIKVAGCDQKQEALCKYLVELPLQDYKFLQFLPSTIAASAMYLSNQILGKQAWSPLLQAHSKKSVDQISACLSELRALAMGDPAKYKAVRKKYSHKKFFEVSKLTVPSA